MESDSERKKNCMVIVVCNEDKENPVTCKWKRGKDELPIVDQYIMPDTYIGVEISKDGAWDAHIAKVVGKGIQYHVGKMDGILANPL